MTVIADPFDEVQIDVPQVPVQRRTASPAAIKYAVDLMVQKLGVEREVAQAQAEALEPRKVAEVIDKLRFLPNAPKAPAPDAVTQDGMYRNPETGDIFKVQKAVHGSGNLYAKLLVVDQARELDAEGNVLVKGEAHFEYAPGAIKSIKAEWRMSLEEGKKYGALYGVCVRCSKTLTLEVSIERAMGRTCAGKSNWS